MAATVSETADGVTHLALSSKVVPDAQPHGRGRGRSAGVVRDDDSLETTSTTPSPAATGCATRTPSSTSSHCTEEMVQLEHWGCPWSRRTTAASTCALLRRHEDAAHLVRRRQDRLPHAAHAVPDLAQVPVDQAASTSSSSPTCWSRTAACAAWSPSRSPPASSSLIEARPWSSAPAAPGACTARTPTPASSPATAWAWPTATACRCATWSSCSTTRPALPGTGILITEGCRGEGGDPAQQGRLPLPAGLRPRPADPWPRPRRWSSARATA
jgi:fumarate reductase flavoprotein subunit